METQEATNILLAYREMLSVGKNLGYKYRDSRFPSQLKICHHCKSVFIDTTCPDQTGRFCSKRCCRNYRNARTVVKDSDRHKVYHRDKYICQICGISTIPDAKNPGLRPTIDHVKPWAEGGKNIVSNYQTAHAICNSTRQTKPGEVRRKLILREWAKENASRRHY